MALVGVKTNVGKKFISGFDQDQDIMDAVNLMLIINAFILSQSDFRIVLFGIFPLY